MKSYFAIILIIGIFGITGLGFLAMNHGTGHESDCFAVKFGGSGCAVWNTVLESFSVHVSPIKNFSNVPLVNAFSIASLFLSILWLLGIIIVLRFAPFQTLRQRGEYSSTISSECSKREIRSWLARREHSPDIW